MVGVNAGHAFSFLRDAASELAFVNVAAAGSQFRSRDLFAKACAAVVRGAAGALAEGLEPDLIPDIPEAAVAYIDGFGNLKTTLRAPVREPGCTLPVTIGGHTREVVVADSSFGVAQGRLCLAPGSSGWGAGEGGVRWLELFLRGGSAFEAFGQPALGAALELG